MTKSKTASFVDRDGALIEAGLDAAEELVGIFATETNGDQGKVVIHRDDIDSLINVLQELKYGQ